MHGSLFFDPFDAPFGITLPLDQFLLLAASFTLFVAVTAQEFHDGELHHEGL